MTSAAAGGNGQAPDQPASPAGGNGQAPAPAQVNNNPAPSGAQNGQAPTATAPSAADIARMTQELAEARRDAAKYRADLQKFQDAQLTAEQKRERDFEQAQKSATDAQRELQELRLTRAIERKAAAFNLINPEIAARLLNRSELEFDDAGAPKNLDKLLTALIQAEPYLVAAANGQPQQPVARPASSGGATNPGAGGVQPGAAGGSGATITAASYRAMSQQERILRNKEVQDTLRRFGGRLPD